MSRQSNISVDQGTDCYFNVVVDDQNGNPILLSGFTATAQIRKHYNAQTAINFTVTINTSATPNFITLYLPANASTLAANVNPGRYYYDVNVVNTQNIKTRVVEGIVTIRGQVTLP